LWWASLNVHKGGDGGGGASFSICRHCLNGDPNNRARSLMQPNHLRLLVNYKLAAASWWRDVWEPVRLRSKPKPEASLDLASTAASQCFLANCETFRRLLRLEMSASKHFSCSHVCRVFSTYYLWIFLFVGRCSGALGHNKSVKSDRARHCCLTFYWLWSVIIIKNTFFSYPTFCLTN